MVRQVVDIDQTRKDIRHTFALWGIDPSEFEILWQEDTERARSRLPGAIVRYMRGGSWQSVSCYGFPTRAQNLRQCFLLLDRLRIAEQQGVQYEGLTFTKNLTVADRAAARKEELLDAYDILGVSPEDPMELVEKVYRNKSMYYHPDKGGDAEKFKRLTRAYERICESRGVKP